MIGDILFRYWQFGRTENPPPAPYPALDAAIYSAIESLVDGRVFPSWAPFDTQLPLIVYHQVGGKVVNLLDCSAPGIRNARVQLDVLADTPSEARSLADEAVGILRASLQANALGAGFDMQEPALGIWRSTRDVSIWRRRS